MSFLNENDLFSDKKESAELKKIIKFADKLHNYMRDNVGLTEEQKPLLITGIILALQDNLFSGKYMNLDRKEIGIEVLSAINNVFQKAGISEDKIINLINTFSFMSSHEGLILTNKDFKTNLQYCIEIVDKSLSPFMSEYIGHDILGRFYSEFISYSGGDGKGLGVVLTPKHITELMADLINVDEKSIVLDTCTGTGAFLIAAMDKMIIKANENIKNLKDKEMHIKNIKENQLIGIEKLSNMYAMAYANMVFRGDGKSNLFNGSCFDFESQIKSLKPTHALINPPYSQKGDGLQEIDFIKYTLDCLVAEGKLAAIVPMSVAIDIQSKKISKRHELLKGHRLDAVFSMNDQLFHPYANTCTCIMLFTAHIPHNTNENHKAFFGYYKTDGHVITKKGRLDKKDTWQTIKDNWINLYNNKTEIAGLTINQKVSENDEWCAESYILTDYESLKDEDFSSNLLNYAGFKLLNRNIF